MNPPINPTRLRAGPLHYARMLKTLIAEPCTVLELVAETGLHERTITNYVNALHHAKVVHIGGWEVDAAGRATIRVFAFGAKKDVKRPKISGAERAKRCRDKKRQATLLGLLA